MVSKEISNLFQENNFNKIRLLFLITFTQTKTLFP